MNTPIKALIVESQPLMKECVTKAFQKVGNSSSELEFKIHTAKDCDTANKEIEKAVLGTPFDLVLLDIKLPSSKDKSLLCGEDVAIKLKNLFPKVKIIVLTTLSDTYRIHNVLQTINPEGFLIKTETDDKRLRKAIRDAISNIPSYTATVSKVMRTYISNEFLIDRTDRRILYELSQGLKNSEVYQIMGISKSCLELRKAKIKDHLNLYGCDDRALIKCAKEKGFI